MFKVLLAIFLMTGIAFADVYVVTNSSGNIYSISNQNDAVIPTGYKLTVMKGKDISNLPISGNPQLYNFNNGAFTLNSTAVTSQQTAQAQEIAVEQAQNAAKASAIAKLTDAISKVDVNDVLTNAELNAVLP